MDVEFQRLDQFDYEKFRLKKDWYFTDAVPMLVSFYMESKGFFDSTNAKQIFFKVCDNFADYIWCILKSKQIKAEQDFGDGIDTDPDFEFYHISEIRFKSEDFLDHLKVENHLKLDFALLSEFLSGRYVAGTMPSEARETSTKQLEPSVASNVGHEIEREDVSISESTKNKYLFVKKMDFWDVVFDGKQIIVKDSMGMRYIAELIRQKHESVVWSDLYHAAQGVAPDSIGVGGNQEALGEGYNVSDQKQMHVYAGADLKLLKNQIGELKEELSEAKAGDNLEEAERLEDYIDQIKKHIMDTYRKDGTLKENSGNTDKMMNGIKAAIKRAIDDIEKDLPALRDHLTDSIVLKWQRSLPSYSPPVDIDWVL